MSVFNVLSGREMVRSRNDEISKQEIQNIEDLLKNIIQRIENYAAKNNIQYDEIPVRKSNTLVVIKDAVKYHIIFVKGNGTTKLNYWDRVKEGIFNTSDIVKQINVKLGLVDWGFSFLQREIINIGEDFIDKIVLEYLETLRQTKKDSSEMLNISSEIKDGIENLKKDNPDKKIAFIMMQFDESEPYNNIVRSIKDILQEFDIVGLRADDKQYLDDLFPNVKVYMHGCDFGIAVFERISEDNFNPNVSLEVGYMLAKGTNVLLLKDKTLKTLQTDLVNRIYREFDIHDIENTLRKVIKKWLEDKGYVSEG